MSRTLIAIACLALVGCSGPGNSAKLSPLSSGAMPKMGGYQPQRLTLTPERPASVTKQPEGLVSPRYGVITIGPDGDAKHAFTLILDEPDAKPASLFVDANGNGDLTDDPGATWKSHPVKGRDGNEYKQYDGGATIQLTLPEAAFPAHIGMYRFDPTDPARAAQKDLILYYCDYAYEGEATLGGKSYKAMLTDDTTAGDFRGKPVKGEKDRSGVRLLLDVNGNGKFDRQGEAFDIRRPFNVAGTTYEITDMNASGTSFRIVRSSQRVDEVPTPPNHSRGQKITTFTEKTTDGNEVRFPASYKGKVVMIDFWATWCGPCMEEVPNLVKVYEELHPKGFEVLGISLDQKDSLEKVKSVTAEHKMTWPQVYDGKFWDARVATLYAIKGIPAAYLVDGDTGEVIADAGLRGDTLKKIIQDALDKKHAKN